MTLLPDNILRRMSKADRAALGKAGRTADEVTQVCTYRFERDLQRDLRALLCQRGIVPLGARFGKQTSLTSGCPDILFALTGQACAWEAKAKDGKVSEDQSIMHEAMRRDGWRIGVIRNLSEAREFLERWG